MKTKRIMRVLALLLCVYSFISCNKDESGFSSSLIQQTLFDMKGTYHGRVEVDYYHGSSITELSNAIAISRDSLTFQMSLLPIANLITDKNASQILHETGEVTVHAGYDFSQIDEWNINFGLRPKDIVVFGKNDATQSVKLVFSQTFGGDAEIDKNFIMFNISPIELWINGEKDTEFKQLVYHFLGTYE